MSVIHLLNFQQSIIFQRHEIYTAELQLSELNLKFVTTTAPVVVSDSFQLIRALRNKFMR